MEKIRMQSVNLQKANAVMAEVKKAVIGKDTCILKVMAAMIAGGHILLDDIPGVGKTTMALAFSKAMDLKQNRVQFTPDILPADIVGFSMYEKSSGKFVYQPGAVMCNLFLADEINRTSPKTQSALLEAMEEGQCDGGWHHQTGTESFYCTGHPESGGERRYADAAGIPGGPLYDLSDHGISES